MNVVIVKWVVPLAAVGAGYLAGRFLDRVALRWLERLSGRTRWGGDDIILKSLEGVTTVLITAVGAYVAVVHLPFKPAMEAGFIRVLQVVVIGAATVSCARMAGGFGELYSDSIEHGLKHTSILTNVVRLSVFVLGGLIVLQTLGISIAPILTALGVGGLAVALALQDTLSNLFAGFNITVSGQVRQGDYVKLDSGDEGYVTDVAWRFTSIRTLANNTVVVPNAKVAGVILTNCHHPDKEMAVVVPARAAYSGDLARVERAAVAVGQEVMKGTQGGVPSFEPLVRFQGFGDGGVDFAVILRCREYTDQYLVKHDFVRKFHERCLREGIEFPVPARTVHLKGAPAGVSGEERRG